MTAVKIKQKKPSDVYDDWQKTVETLRMVPQNATLIPSYLLHN